MPQLEGSIDGGFKLQEEVSKLEFNQDGLVIDHTVTVNGVTHRIVKFDNNGCVSLHFDEGTGKNFSVSSFEVTTQVKTDPLNDKKAIMVFSRLEK
ncbi:MULTISPECIES: hypothetical protein [Rahnella]|uniref:hypothetical protein n=1 Tax=Rahnella TaxID=34037 RepID=UPI000C34306A|nr:hypothetical protein [Rahnella sp. AA]PKE30972.1 hypothetical protein CWS43_09835 [Rahnella sp. AA]